MRILSLRPVGSLRPLVVALSLAVATIVAPSGMAMAQQPEADIVDTAVAAGSFTTLATALQAAGLVDTLKGDGPFTVFAPTDEAFAKLPAGTLEALLADPAKLQAVLTYHVVPGRVTAADVATHLMRGAAYTSRVWQLKLAGVRLPASCTTYRPTPLSTEDGGA